MSVFRAVVACVAMAVAFGLAACNSFFEPASGATAAKVFLPAAYNADTAQRWPLIISLHGAGGLNPEDNLIDVYASRTPGFPFIVLAPRSEGEWNVASLENLLSAALSSYRVDRTRVYVTGVSMGARGAWNFAAANPKSFAALVLIAGNGDPELACRLRDTPIWLFHNRGDGVVGLGFSQVLFDAHQTCGGETRLTIYDTIPPGTWHHNAWQRAWTTPELYTWLLERHR